MKRIVTIILSACFSFVSFSQTTVNADGSLKLRGNVAIISTFHAFTYQDGKFEQQLNDEVSEQVKTAYRVMAMQAFGNSCFGIVNRDDEAYANVMKQLEEQKLEDYMDGFTVKVKGEGADFLCLIDNTMYTENNFVQQHVSVRFISIATNMGWHYSLKSKPINMANAIEVQKEAAKLADKTLQFLYQRILQIYPEQYAIAKADGKKLYLAAYQPNGRILLDDKWYAFKFAQEQLNVGGASAPVMVLAKEGEANFERADGGYCLVKSNKSLPVSQDIVLFRNQEEPMISADLMQITFFPLSYNPKTHEGYIKNRVNNAVYDAITRHPGAAIIEQEHLPDLKKERELQKTEDFIDGHVVEQMKAFGARFMIHLENFVIQGSKVSFKLNMVSVAENRILRSIDVTTSVDNIENEMYKQICERITYPVNITQAGKKDLIVLSGWALKKGDGIIISANKRMVNPITNETSYTKVPLCSCTVTEYMGNKCRVSVDEIVNEEDYKLLEQYGAEFALSIMMDASAIESDDSEMSDVEKANLKQDRTNERKAFLRGLGNALLNNASVEGQSK